MVGCRETGLKAKRATRTEQKTSVYFLIPLQHTADQPATFRLPFNDCHCPKDVIRANANQQRSTDLRFSTFTIQTP